MFNEQPAANTPSFSALPRSLRLLNYNIQVGIESNGFHDYILKSWRHILPFSHRSKVLDRIAPLVHDFDIVALQEVDGGSLRSNYVNQVEYLAQQASFDYWFSQCNRNFGKIAQHCNGVLSRIRPTVVSKLRLPGMLPGRGGIMVLFGKIHQPLVLIILHLSLGAQSRQLQFDYIFKLISAYEHVIIMGDLNSSIEELDRCDLVSKLDLRYVNTTHNTFPSWNPKRNIDHILVSPSMKIENYQVIDIQISDHLPIALELTLPEIFM